MPSESGARGSSPVTRPDGEGFAQLVDRLVRRQSYAFDSHGHHAAADPTAEMTRENLFDALTDGVGWFSYVGHGGLSQLDSPALLSVDDLAPTAEQLARQSLRSRAIPASRRRPVPSIASSYPTTCHWGKPSCCAKVVERWSAWRVPGSAVDSRDLPGGRPLRHRGQAVAAEGDRLFELLRARRIDLRCGPRCGVDTGDLDAARRPCDLRAGGQAARRPALAAATPAMRQSRFASSSPMTSRVQTSVDG